VVEVSEQVAGTSSRSQKIALLAALLARLELEEVPVAVGFLSGAPRQGRIGVGYRMIYGIDAPVAAAPSLSVGRLDAAIDELERASGSGSAAGRRALLRDLFARATEPEAAFLRRLFTGELRQGALAGLMADAVARAAAVPA